MKNILLSLCLFCATGASAAISLGGDSETLSSRAQSIEQSYSQNMRWEREYISYESTLKMRADRKVGAGVVIGGQLGVVGANMEFNFEDANGVVAGFGTGPGYNSVQMAWKHSFDGDYVAPYTTLGYSRWYNSRGRTKDYSNSPILDRVLTDAEKRDGRFGTDFLSISAGLQYSQLSGPLVGISFYGELVLLTEVKRSMIFPTGTLGTVYYF